MGKHTNLSIEVANDLKELSTLVNHAYLKKNRIVQQSLKLTILLNRKYNVKKFDKLIFYSLELSVIGETRP